METFALKGMHMAEQDKDLIPFASSEGPKTVRRIWHNGEWYYSVIDLVGVLTEAKEPRKYWNQIKARASTEGFEATLQQVLPLRLKSSDGRFRLTDTANRQTMLRIIQAIPSPRAEPVRLWLAQVGEERIEEVENPEAALERVRHTYRAKGYDERWIEERIKNDLIRNALTDEWKDRGAQGPEYAILTNVISEGTFGLSVEAHKTYKLLPPTSKTNLRDHMTYLELALSSLGEATAITLHQSRDSQGFGPLHRDATEAGEVGREARRSIEQRTGQPVVSPTNSLGKTKTKEQHRRLAQQQPSLFDDPPEAE
jgi:DNA-damage-inducible protein D